jgi:hypothetical protein
VSHQDQGRLEQHLAHHDVSAFRDAPHPVDLARLLPARRQAEGGTDRLRAGEPGEAGPLSQWLYSALAASSGISRIGISSVVASGSHGTQQRRQPRVLRSGLEHAVQCSNAPVLQCSSLGH